MSQSIINSLDSDLLLSILVANATNKKLNYRTPTTENQPVVLLLPVLCPA
jgi:hypothetical protein